MKEIFIRHWFERPGRFFLIVLGLMTATTAIVAVLCASYNARASYNRLNQLAAGLPAIDIHQRRGERFDPSIIAELKPPFEINANAPMLFRGTIARHEAERLRCILLGIPLADGASEFYIAENRKTLLSYLDAADIDSLAENECLVSKNAALALQVEAGSEVQLLFRRKIQKLTVRKVVPNEVWQAFAVEPSIIVDLSGLQQWSGLVEQVDRVRYFIEETDESAKEKSAQELGLVLEGELTASVRTSAFGSAASIFRSAELGLSFATTLAGAMSLYILLNTIRMNFLERRRQFAILRCIGATPGQIFLALMIETATLSLLASGIGLIVGVLLGRLLQDVLLNMTNAAPSNYMIPWVPVGVVAAIIPVCSLLITTIAYWEQRDVSPLENFRESPQIASARFPLLVVFTGLGLWLVAFIGLLAVQREQVPYGWAIPAGLVMVIAYLLFLPLGWIPLLSVLSYFNRKGQWFGVDLAKYQLTRRTERTSLSAGFLVIALCGAIGLGQALMSNIAELRRWYEVAFAGDIFLVGVPSQVNDSDDPIRTTLFAKSPELLKWIDSIRFIDMEIEGVTVSSIIREFPEGAPFPGVLKDIEQSEAITQLKAGKLLLNSIVAKRLGKKAGDRVLLQHSGKGLEFEVAGTFVDFRNGGMSILLERKAAQSRFLVTGFDLMAMQCPEADRPSLTKEIESLEGAGSLRIIAGSELRADIDATISSVILGITLVVVTSFVIGGLGIMSTMAMNVAEQTKDFALLRLVGMVRSQVLSSVLIQGLLLGLIGSVFGLIGGTTTAWIIHACSEAILGYTPQFEYSIRLPLISIAGTMLVVVMASLIPAYQATRVDPKQSLQYED